MKSTGLGGGWDSTTRAALGCVLITIAACSSSKNTGTSGVNGSPMAGSAATSAPMQANAGASAATGGSKATTGSGGTAVQASGNSGSSAGGSTATASAGTASGTSGSTSASAGVGGTMAAAGSDSNAGAGAAGGPACDKDLTAQPGQDDCTAPLKPNDDRLCKMMIGGQQRQFYIYAPPSFNACQPAALIMDCHGLSESAEVHTGEQGFNLLGMMYPAGYGSGWRRIVQGDNAIIVTPQGLNDSWDPTTDVPFLNQAADAVEKIASVDKDKEYVTGISMGGQMTVALGCDNSARWRGMVPVAMLTQSCAKLDKPTPFISFHSATDMLTDYSADQSGAANVAMLNHCKMGPMADPMLVWGGPNTVTTPQCFTKVIGVGDPDETDRYGYPIVPCQSALPESSCVKWTQCDDGVEVAFCTVSAANQPLGGHILYHNDTALQLASVAWPFLKQFWK